jgi:hypothetical protein
MRKLAIASIIPAALAATSLFAGTAFAATEPTPPQDVGNWNGQYPTGTSSHCDNIGDPTYAQTHVTGSQPGASSYHIDTTPGAGPDSCGGVRLGFATGYLTVGGGTVALPSSSTGRNNCPTCTVAGGIYGGPAISGTGTAADGTHVIVGEEVKVP